MSAFIFCWFCLSVLLALLVSPWVREVWRQQTKKIPLMISTFFSLNRLCPICSRGLNTRGTEETGIKPSVLNLSHGESVPAPSRCIILRLTIFKSQSRNQRCQYTMAFDRARIANKWGVIVASWRPNHWYASLIHQRICSTLLKLPQHIFCILSSSFITREVLISIL